MSLEFWKTAFEISGVILLFLTFLSGAGVLLTSTRINVRQADRLRQFDIELAKQQERAAKAERELLEERQNTANRDLTAEAQHALSEKLKSFAGQRVSVDVFPVTFEHVSIAATIFGILGNAKWDLSPSIGELSAPPGADIGKPLLVQGIWVQSTPDDKSTKAANALFEALKSTVASGILTHDPLPDSNNPRVWVYVGDKPTPARSWVK